MKYSTVFSHFFLIIALPCILRMHALHSGNQMQCRHRLCKVRPFHLSLRKESEL